MNNLTEEDLKTLQVTKFNSTIMKLKAETAAVESGRAAAEAQVAELEYENTLLRIYINYGLGNNHIINETTGKIKTKEQKEPNDEQQNENY